jgi:hypothetical protein
MRRNIMIATAVSMLVAAGAAYAALNTYTATMTFSPTKAGSAKSPSALGYTQVLAATPVAPNVRAAPLVDIKTTVYGMVANPKPFPTCSSATILTGPKFNANCPSGSLVASGQVTAQLGKPDLTKPGGSCKPGLSVYNAGNGKLWFFFTTKTAADCGGLPTGATPPYPGTLKKSGKNLVTDVPLPPFVSTAVANQTGVYGSLTLETINWKKLTTKVKGKSVAFLSSVGCKAGKRPWTVAFSAVATATSAPEVKTVTGAPKC